MLGHGLTRGANHEICAHLRPAGGRASSCAVILSGIAFHRRRRVPAVWFGYTVMVVAMTFLFVGVNDIAMSRKAG